MSEPSQGAPLEELERRWSLEQSPQLTLQLAEELRRHGDLDRALTVLREGLEKHPGHMAARVALGRYLIEAGQPEEAASTLQEVVDRDPTHLVANKLLVRAALALGDAQRARDRLDLYATLTAGDSDLEGLETEVAAAEEEARSETETFEGGEPGSGGEPDLEPAPEPSLEEETEPAGSDRPFPGLGRSLDVASYRQAIEAEGLFVLAGAAAGESTGEESRRSDTTVTLGRLYLEQGHRQEAEEIFRAVLERDRENEEARIELAGAAAGGALSAANLVGVAELTAAGSATQRKRLVLERYLERIRRVGGERA